ncbi:MAG: guanylate kinase [Nitrospirae bacterium]|nr:guanylate kinase [Nitrospirota bacterium]MBI3352562.1 guanylate kinase [Nitrospirota bacterium]
MNEGSNKQGQLIIVSAPSGAGKTSLCKKVVEQVKDVKISISYTTRSCRNGEVEGQDYYFIDKAQFRAMIENNEFLEYAEVHGNLYGTSRNQLMTLQKQGYDLLLDIDSQGAMQLKKKYKEGVYVYILPPSFEILKSRLMERNSDSPEEIAKRLKKAREEIWNYREYYYLIINDEFKEAIEDLKSIILAERIKMRRMNFSWIEETFIKVKEGV